MSEDDKRGEGVSCASESASMIRFAVAVALSIDGTGSDEPPEESKDVGAGMVGVEEGDARKVGEAEVKMVVEDDMKVGDITVCPRLVTALRMIRSKGGGRYL